MSGKHQYPQVNLLTLCRIWEKLSEDGWREELEARKSSYESGVLKFKGVIMARPLGDKGMHDPNP